MSCSKSNSLAVLGALHSQNHVTDSMGTKEHDLLPLKRSKNEPIISCTDPRMFLGAFSFMFKACLLYLILKLIFEHVKS